MIQGRAQGRTRGEPGTTPKGTSPMTTQTKSLPLLFLVTALIGACTTMTPQPVSSLPYFIGTKPQPVRRDVMSRYACDTGAVLICRCTSRLAASCDCECPLR